MSWPFVRQYGDSKEEETSLDEQEAVCTCCLACMGQKKHTLYKKQIAEQSNDLQKAFMNMASYGTDTTRIPQSLEQPYYDQPPKVQGSKRLTRRKPRLFHQNRWGAQMQETDGLSYIASNDENDIDNRTVMFPAFTFPSIPPNSIAPRDASPTCLILSNTTHATTPETVVTGNTTGATTPEIVTYTQTSTQ